MPTSLAPKGNGSKGLETAFRASFTSKLSPKGNITMDIKPRGKYLKSYQAGYLARQNGESIDTNPNRYAPDVSMSSWWESGWIKADVELLNRKSVKGY